MSTIIFQPLLSAHVTSGLRQNILVEFSEKTRRENTAFRENFCSIRISLLNALVVHFWNLAALGRHLPNSGWLSRLLR